MYFRIWTKSNYKQTLLTFLSDIFWCLLETSHEQQTIKVSGGSSGYGFKIVSK